MKQDSTELIEITCDVCGETWEIPVNFDNYTEMSVEEAIVAEAETQGWEVGNEWMCPECAEDLMWGSRD